MKTTAFHLSLNVQDLERSLTFYEALFGSEPDKVRPDYARFTLAEPPVVLSLIPSASLPIGGQRVSHLGVRFTTAETLETARQRLVAAGLEVRAEPESTCCYAVQDKYWVYDPDGNEWEFYRVLVDSETRGGREACCET